MKERPHSNLIIHYYVAPFSWSSFNLTLAVVKPWKIPKSRSRQRTLRRLKITMSPPVLSPEVRAQLENEREKKLIKALTLLHKSVLSIFNSLYAVPKELPISLRYCLTLSCGRNRFSIIRNFGLRHYTKKFSVIIIRSFLHFYRGNIIDPKLSYSFCHTS